MKATFQYIPVVILQSSRSLISVYSEIVMEWIHPKGNAFRKEVLRHFYLVGLNVITYSEHLTAQAKLLLYLLNKLIQKSPSITHIFSV